MKKVSHSITVRKVAELAGVSPSTVCRVLNNNPNVAEATRQKVQKVIEKKGYRPNPMVSALMSYQRSIKKVKVTAQLAVVCREFTSDFSKNIYAGAVERARERGFGVDQFFLEEGGVSDKRLSDIIYNRGIRGVLLLPVVGLRRNVDFDWERFSAAAIGYSIESPALHRIISHQAHGLRLALRKAKEFGWQRIGFATSTDMNLRVDKLWLGAYCAEQMELPKKDRIPPFILEDFPENHLDRHEIEKKVGAWVRRHDIDLIIGSSPFDYIRDMMIRRKKQKGERSAWGLDVAYVSMNCGSKTPMFSGIHQNPIEIGRVATDYIASMLMRHEVGIPEIPQVVLVENEWADGVVYPLKKKRKRRSK